jgi:hypothetical protein
MDENKKIVKKFSHPAPVGFEPELSGSEKIFYILPLLELTTGFKTLKKFSAITTRKFFACIQDTCKNVPLLCHRVMTRVYYLAISEGNWQKFLHMRISEKRAFWTLLALSY